MRADIALVTGASTETGYHLAHQLCAHGHPVVLVATDESELDWIAAELLLQGAEVRAIACGGESGNGPQQVLDELAADGINIGIIANNAGLTAATDIAGLPLQRHLTSLRLNAQVALGMTALLLPGMLARGNGHVLNLLSRTEFASAPLRSACEAYNASMLFWSDALTSQLQATPVGVTALVSNTDEGYAFQQGTTARDIARAAYRSLTTREPRVRVGAMVPALPFQLDPTQGAANLNRYHDGDPSVPLHALRDAIPLHALSR